MALAMSSLMAAIALGAAPHWAAGSWELLPEEAGEVGAFTCADEPLHITLDEPAMRFHGERGDFAYSASLLALGEDPLRFEKAGEPIIDVGPPGSIDETYAHKPSLIHHDGVLYHFYCAVSGKWPNETRGIAVARSVPW